MRRSPRPSLASLLTMRAAVILTIPCVIGATAGVLTYLASHSVPQALLASGAAVGGSAQLLRQLTETAPERPTSAQDDNDALLTSGEPKGPWQP